MITKAIVVLSDGETWSSIEGCIVAYIPEDIYNRGHDAIEEYLREDKFEYTSISEVIESDY